MHNHIKDKHATSSPIATQKQKVNDIVSFKQIIKTDIAIDKPSISRSRLLDSVKMYKCL